MTKQVIMFCGKAGSGKSSASMKLVEEQGFKKYSFADSLRDIAFSTIGISHLSKEEYSELKKKEVINGLTLRNVLEKCGESINKVDDTFFPRVLLNRVKKDFIGKENVALCIDDLRHAREYFVFDDYCKKNNVTIEVYFCDYRSEMYQERNSHESARMAQYLTDLGYKHLEKVSINDLYTYSEIFERST